MPLTDHNLVVTQLTAMVATLTKGTPDEPSATKCAAANRQALIDAGKTAATVDADIAAVLAALATP
jgi:hypothetical protein